MGNILVDEARILGQNFTNDPVTITSSHQTGKCLTTVVRITLINEKGSHFNFEASVPNNAIETFENIGQHDEDDIIIDQVCVSKYGIALRLTGGGVIRFLLKTEAQLVGQNASVTFSHYTKQELLAAA